MELDTSPFGPTISYRTPKPGPRNCSEAGTSWGRAGIHKISEEEKIPCHQFLTRSKKLILNAIDEVLLDQYLNGVLHREMSESTERVDHVGRTEGAPRLGRDADDT